MFDNITVSGVAGVARTFQVQYQAEFSDALGYGGGTLVAALRGLANACDALQTAKAKAATILADPRLAQNVKVQEARVLVNSAIIACNEAADEYAQQLADTTAAIRAALVPKPPTSNDEGLLVLRAQEVIKRLEATVAAARVNVAGKRLADALATGDTIMAYILAGGALLTDTYSRLGMKAEMVQETFASVISQAQSTTKIPGAKLLTLLTKGGSDTLTGLRDLARYVFSREAQAAAQSLPGYLAVASIAGPGAPGGSR